jgi:hypothetical protein
MSRLSIISAAVLILATAMPAAAQSPEQVRQMLVHQRDLCDQGYKPGCIRFGFLIGQIHPAQLEEWRRRYPDWWWWERW